MISNREQLRKRGYIEEEDIERFRDKTEEELFLSLSSRVAMERTASVRILSKRYCNEVNFTNHLLLQLKNEKCLYTKLEICEVLQKGNADTARQMLSYLGKIGANQHKQLPDKVSEKKSFPLPRDLIARTLGKMSPQVLPIILEALETGSATQNLELFDGIGFVIFYNQECATLDNAKRIIQVMERFSGNELMQWKGVLCLCAFPFPEVKQVLENRKLEYANTLIAAEANRSLSIISQKKNT